MPTIREIGDRQLVRGVLRQEQDESWMSTSGKDTDERIRTYDTICKWDRHNVPIILRPAVENEWELQFLGGGKQGHVGG